MDPYWIWLNLLGGILVLGSYLVFVPKIPQKRLWAGITHSSLKLLYGISMILATVFYLIFFFKSQTSLQSLVVLLVFFISSALWTPSLLYKTPWLTLLCLTLTSVSVLFLFLMEKNKLSKFCLLYFLFHVLVLDNLYWGIKYFKII